MGSSSPHTPALGSLTEPQVSVPPRPPQGTAPSGQGAGDAPATRAAGHCWARAMEDSEAAKLWGHGMGLERQKQTRT